MASQIGGYGGDEIRIRKADFYRLIAWYGAVRCESGRGPHELGKIKPKRDAALKDLEASRANQASRILSGGSR